MKHQMFVTSSPRRFAVVICFCLAALIATAGQGRSQRTPSIPDVPCRKTKLDFALARTRILRALNTEMQLEKFKQLPQIRVKEFFALLPSFVKIDDKPLKIMVDVASFESEAPKAAPFLQTEVSFLNQPQGISLDECLRFVFANSKPHEATYLIRRGGIVITTKKKASLESLLKERIVRHLEKMPLGIALQEVGAIAGASIQLDVRAKEQLHKEITAIFANDVTLGTAVEILADMGGLEAVQMKGCLYVTTPENAKQLRSRLSAK